METTAIALPISALTVGVLGILSILLSINVVRHRVRTKASLSQDADPALQVACRVFGNFAEYVPLALIVLAVSEMNRLSTAVLWVVAGCIVAGRLIHMVGLSVEKPVTVARVVGVTLTWVSIGVGSVGLILAAVA